MIHTMIDMSPQEDANKVKEVVVGALVADGYLTAEKGSEFLARYAVVLRGRSWFGRIFDKLRGEVLEEHLQYTVVRVVWGPEKDG